MQHRGFTSLRFPRSLSRAPTRGRGLPAAPSTLLRTGYSSAKEGFTLLELIVVIGIIGVAAGISVPVYRDYQIRSDLYLATEQVTQGLGRAQMRAQSAEEDDAWGFYVPAGVLFKGESYATRDPSFDELYPMPATIGVTGILEVAYSKIEGKPSLTGPVTLTTINEDQRTIFIRVEEESVAIVENDTLMVCHRSPGNPDNRQTITVSDSAWPAHQAHGDTMGTCPAGSSAASSAGASSVASSTGFASSAGDSTPPDCGEGTFAVCHYPPGHPANRQSQCIGENAWTAHRGHGDSLGACASEGEPPPASPSCTDRFSIEEDGTIVTTGTVSLAVTALGSAITYGENGPEVNVYGNYSKNGGEKWYKLWNGADTDGGESQTITEIAGGSEVLVKVQGYFKQRGWLTFDRTYRSDDESGHVVLLRDGAPVPTYPAFGDQQNLSSFLQNIIDDSGHIDIAPYDIVLLAELGDLDTEAADFQDAVFLLQFSAPSECGA